MSEDKVKDVMKTVIVKWDLKGRSDEALIEMLAELYLQAEAIGRQSMKDEILPLLEQSLDILDGKYLSGKEKDVIIEISDKIKELK